MYYQDNSTISTEYKQHNEKILGGIGSVLFKYMTKHSKKIGQIDATTGETQTFSLILQRCIRTSIILQKKGIKRGDIVTYYSDIHINAVVPIVSCFFIGAIPSFLDAVIPLSDATHLLKTVSPKLLITDNKYLETVKGIVDNAHIDTKLIVFNDEFFKYQDEENIFKPIYVDDLGELAIIHFSSGTTGEPKGICLNHYRFLIFKVVEDDGLWKEEQHMVIHSYDSLYWSIETHRLVSSIRRGVCRLINSRPFDPIEIWNIIQEYRMCTVGKPKDVDLSSLTTLYSGGSSLPIKNELILREMLPTTDIFQYYGQTEVGLLMTFLRTDLHRKYSKNKTGSIGLPTTGAGICYKVVDEATGVNLGPNNQGELRVKSKTAMLGYCNQDSSDRFDENGWLKTGDLVSYDEDLCFFLTGRIKDLIIYQGWHIAPASLETELLSHPLVVKAAVIGEPHALDGERPVGFVVVNDVANTNAVEIEEYMKTRLPNQPMRIKLLEEIPITLTGKVKREELKRMILSEKN